MRQLGDPDPVELKKGEERMARYAPVLDDHLKGREWLCGGTVTLADFTVGSYLDLAEAALSGQALRGDLAMVSQHRIAAGVAAIGAEAFLTES